VESLADFAEDCRCCEVLFTSVENQDGFVGFLAIDSLKKIFKQDQKIGPLLEKLKETQVEPNRWDPEHLRLRQGVFQDLQTATGIKMPPVRLAPPEKHKIRLKYPYNYLLLTFIYLLLALLSGMIVFLIVSSMPPITLRLSPNPATVTIDGRSFSVIIANTPATQKHELPILKCGSERIGILTVFTRPEIQDDWMQNTSVPIDVIFIDDQKRIINICSGPPPANEKCKSDRPAKYALKLKAGSARHYKFQSGQPVSINLIP
jgi:uncharacterized membrane protein (UPF0127 family)